jgi:sensor domain CHASE-containing protein
MNTLSRQGPSHYSPDLDTQMARFGLRVAASLSERSRDLPHDVSERLRFAREQAVMKAHMARAAQTEKAVSPQIVRNGTTLALNGMGGRSSQGWLKFASFMPLLMLVAGLLLIQHGQWYEQIMAAADIDTALLSDKLPPAAYGDPGFSEYLSDEQE